MAYIKKSDEMNEEEKAIAAKLKPCPFCSCRPEVRKWDLSGGGVWAGNCYPIRFAIVCKGKECMTEAFEDLSAQEDDMQKYIKMWNTRERIERNG